MKREVKEPVNKRNTLQSLIDFLVENGMTQFSANQFVHINIPAIGGDKNIMNLIQEGNWDDAWGVAESYIRGDYF